jgi:CheY-like chemotaxis protein
VSNPVPSFGARKVLKRRVLVVDDDVDTLEDTRALLLEHGYDVLVAEDGQEAFDVLLSQGEEPCVVVLDLNMPRMDGWTLLSLMRRYARFRQIPVVLLTGTSVTPYGHAPFDEVLRKPVTPQAVVHAVDRWCTAHHGQHR